MILQSLVKLYETLADQGKVSRPGWCNAKVSYAVVLNHDGTIKDIVSVKQKVKRGKKTVEIPIIMQVPEMVTRANNIASSFLCENAKYLFGIDEKMSLRTLECFKAAKKKHLDILDVVDSPVAQTVCNFFRSWDPEQALDQPAVAKLAEEFYKGGNLVFEVDGEYVHDNEEVRRAWMDYSSVPYEMVTGRCLITGEEAEIARTHGKIKGVPGAQSSGASLVSFNGASLESYEKTQSYNAPISTYAAYAYVTALNYLLSTDGYHSKVGDSMVVFWTDSGDVDDVSRLRKMMGSINEKDHTPTDTDEKLYVLCLAPNAGRIEVRFFYEDAIGVIWENLSEHASRMKIVKPVFEDQEFINIWQMLMETVNQNLTDKTPVPHMSAMTLQSVISDTPYPQSLYAGVLSRIRAEHKGVTYRKASIIKAFLIKNYKWEEGKNMEALNEGCKDRAYILGRLFAVMEKAQKEAVGNINQTICDKFYNSACTTPRSIFPVLIRLSNSHLSKLKRTKPGRGYYFTAKMQDLMDKIPVTDDDPGFPRRFSYEDQGKFALGYYHQMRAEYTSSKLKDNDSEGDQTNAENMEEN